MGLDKINEKLTTCCHQPYKVVFIDQNMPILDGLQVMCIFFLIFIDDEVNTEKVVG